jgi:hypothetical protein
MKKYKMGYAEGDTKAELGQAVIEHCGLKIEDDEMIGKTIKFKNPKYPAYFGTFTIVARQMRWGYDKAGVYCMVPGYRVTNEENQFGMPCGIEDIEVID